MEHEQLDKESAKNIFNSNAFRQIEKKIIQEAVSEASNTARRELELFKFELVYPQIVSEKERNQVEREVIKTRDKKWKKALKKARGDEEKALLIV